MSFTPIPREAFVAADRYVYLDHAGVAPISRPAAEAMRRWTLEAEQEGSLAGAAWRGRAERVRADAARICGVPADDVAFAKNTTEGLAFVASGLEWTPGDRVVVPDCEFPSTIYPWLALADRGVEVVRVQPVGAGGALPIELFEAELQRAETKLVCVSWVSFGRGWRIDLEALGRLCRDQGVMLCVDAIQGLGVIPAEFEAWGVDFAAADAHKWLCGPEGIAIFYARSTKRDLLHVLEPGWHSVVHRRQWDNLDYVPDPTARRFEGGSHNAAGIHGLGASLELLLAAGIERVWAYVDELCDYAVDRLRTEGTEVLTERGEGASGIVTFRLPGHESGVLAERLRSHGFVCAGPRGGGVRISPHGYNTREEIDAFVEGLARHAS